MNEIEVGILPEWVVAYLINLALRHVISFCGKVGHLSISHLVSLLELLHKHGTALLYLVIDLAHQKVFRLL